MGDAINHGLQHYGYLAVIIGCLLEGEMVVILAGIAVHAGLFSLPLLIGMVWFGGMLGDIVLYLLGHYFGQALLARLSWRKGRVRRMQMLIRRHQFLAIFGVRFLYGLRIVGPVVIGTSGIPVRTFLLPNLLGAAIWAVLFTLLGYLIGPAVLKVYAQVEQYQGWLWAGIVLLLVLWWVGHYWLSRRRQ